MNIDKLSRQLTHIKRQRNKCKKDQEYNARQLKKPGVINDFKKYQKFFIKEKMYNDRIQNLEAKIYEIEQLIAGFKYKAQYDAYREKVKAFDIRMIGKLVSILIELDKLIEDIPSDTMIVEKVFDYYVKNRIGLKQEDLEPYHYLFIELNFTNKWNRMIAYHANQLRSSSSRPEARSSFLKQWETNKTKGAALIQGLVNGCLGSITSRYPKKEISLSKKIMYKLKDLKANFSGT